MNRNERNPERRPHRVLVEAPPYPWHSLVKEAERLGACDVTLCGGPSCTHEPCPVAHGEPCPKADEVDVIVAGLGLDTDEGREIVRGLRSHYANKSIIVPVWPADLARHADLLEGCRVVVFPWTMKKFTAAVHDALDDTDGS